MLSDDVAEQGFVLLCCGKPESDCAVRTVDEARAHAACVGVGARGHAAGLTHLRAPPAQEELLAVQMHSGAL